MLALFAYEKSKPTGGVIDLVYHANSALLLQDETSYRFEYVSLPLSYARRCNPEGAKTEFVSL